MDMMLDKNVWFQKGTNLKEIKCRIDICCSFLFIAPVMILFDQSSYVYREETIIFEIFINSKKHDFYKFERRIYPESLVHHQEFKVLRGVCVFFPSRSSF